MNFFICMVKELKGKIHISNPFKLKSQKKKDGGEDLCLGVILYIAQNWLEFFFFLLGYN